MYSVADAMQEHNQAHLNQEPTSWNQDTQKLPKIVINQPINLKKQANESAMSMLEQNVQQNQLNTMNKAIQKASPEKIRTVEEILNKVRSKVQQQERMSSYQPANRSINNQSE